MDPDHHHHHPPAAPPITSLQQRLIIALDEWPGILLCIYLRSTHSPIFWWFAIPWAIAVYGISYPLYWWWPRAKEGKTSPMAPLFTIARHAKERKAAKARSPAAQLAAAVRDAERKGPQ
jgi:hypothetical protein